MQMPSKNCHFCRKYWGYLLTRIIILSLLIFANSLLYFYWPVNSSKEFYDVIHSFTPFLLTTFILGILGLLFLGMYFLPNAQRGTNIRRKPDFLSRPIWGHSFYPQSGHLATRLRLRFFFPLHFGTRKGGVSLVTRNFSNFGQAHFQKT